RRALAEGLALRAPAREASARARARSERSGRRDAGRRRVASVEAPVVARREEGSRGTLAAMPPRTPGWDAWISGEIRFATKAKLTAWKKHDVDARAFGDWPDWIRP